jgi:hypothetical protein
MVSQTLVEWLPVPGYEGDYSVSSLGHVYRHSGKGCRKGRLLKTPRNGAGYPHVSLSKNGRSKDWTVHKLMALAFYGECPEGLEVRHLDDNKTNNRVENLAYGTRSENVQDSIRNGTYNGGMRPRGL